MKHTLDELLQIVYRHYPRGMWDFEPGYDDTVEFRRIDAARKLAASSKEWLALLDRLRMRFNGGIFNNSMALAGFKTDSCTWVTHLHRVRPTDPRGDSIIGLGICFIAPYYVVYSDRKIDRTYRESGPRLFHPFDFDDDEIADAQIMVDEMKALYPEHVPMPPEVGNIVVPDVMAGNQRIGIATLYHCFFTDAW